MVSQKIKSSYLPEKLSKKDREIQKEGIKKSRSAYKEGKYKDRPKVKYKSVPSPHIKRAEKIYTKSTKELLKHVPGCKKGLIEAIRRKGRGAYYSSGSRPNQTASSWANARLASAISGGKASIVDRSEIKKYCSKTSEAYKRMARRMSKQKMKQKSSKK